MAALQRIAGARLPLREASGLAYHPERGTLFSVGDDTGKAYEIGLGDSPSVVREVPLEDGKKHDLEGIAIARDGGLLVAAERKRRILRYGLDGALRSKHDVEIRGKSDNAGLEGLSVDPESGRIFAVHERKPKRLLELSSTFEVVRSEKIKGLDDLSGVCAHGGSLWIVSDDSAELVRLAQSEDGWELAERWSLERTSAEGIAIVGPRLYIAYDSAKTDEDNLVWYDLPSPDA